MKTEIFNTFIILPSNHTSENRSYRYGTMCTIRNDRYLRLFTVASFCPTEDWKYPNIQK